MAELSTRQNGEWVAASGARSRGPDGTRKPRPDCPDYGTPADVTVAWAGLQAAINAATPGEVTTIHVTGDLADTITLSSPDLAGGMVFIRPAAGRCLANQIIIENGEDLVVGGITIRPDTPYDAAFSLKSARSWFWRCVDEAHTNWGHDATSTNDNEDSGYCECVNPTWWFAAENDGGHLSTGPTAALVRPVWDGCYLAPRFSGPWMFDWAEGTFPGDPIDIYVPGSVVAGAVQAVRTLVSGAAYDGTPLGMIVAYLETPPTDTTPVIVEVRVNGVVWQTITLNASADLKHGYLEDLNRTFIIGDVITYRVTQAGAGAAGLHVIMGVQTAGNGSTARAEVHTDTIQSIADGEQINDARFVDCIVGGAFNTKTFQLDDFNGDWTWDNCEIHRIAGGHGYGNNNGLVANKGREHVVYCDFTGDVDLDTEGSLKTFKYNTAANFVGAFVPDETNTERGTAERLSPCPDLTEVWPECPYLGRTD